MSALDPIALVLLGLGLLNVVQAIMLTRLASRIARMRERFEVLDALERDRRRKERRAYQ